MNEENTFPNYPQTPFPTTTIRTNDGVWVRTDEWEGEVWLELELDNGSFHVIMTPDETKLVIEGLQKVLDLFEKKNVRPVP